MDIGWVSEPEPGSPVFDDAKSPYAHYWLSTLPAERSVGLLAKQRSTVDLTDRLAIGTSDLIARAFGR